MAIDLTKLPPPAIIQTIDYRVILQSMKNELIALNPDLSEALSYESEPLTQQLQVAAYREMIIRQDFNDRAKAILLAYTYGANLDHIGVTYYRTERLVISPGDPNATPPINPVYESDDDYRNRCLIAEDGYSTAGPEDAYIYHAKSADGDVKDVRLTSPLPVQVVVSVLSHTGDGTASAALLSKVTNALNNQVRPLTDAVTVQSAIILGFSVNATLIFYSGPDQVVVMAAAEARLVTWLDNQHRLGRDITVAGIVSALNVTGVHNVILNTTVATDIIADKIVADTEAAYCTAITIISGGVGE